MSKYWSVIAKFLSDFPFLPFVNHQHDCQWILETPAVFSLVETNLSAFPPSGVVHLCRCECSRWTHQKWTKQAYQYLVEEVVMVHFQTDSGAVLFWWEHYPTLVCTNCRKHCAFLDYPSSRTKLDALRNEEACPLSRQQQHASMSNMDKHGEWNNVISDDQRQNQPHSCLCVVKLIVVGALSARLCLYLRSLPTWQFWPCGEQFRIYGCAPTLVTFYPGVKFFFFVTL